MSISSVGGASALSQLYSAQQAQALSAVSVDAPADSTSEASALQADNDNTLTGSTTANLTSQTLQALLDLTQQDPAGGTDPSQASQQTQGAHHRHGHHHGGGMTQAPPGSPAQPSNAAATGSDPSLTATAEAGDESDEASLTSALMHA